MLRSISKDLKEVRYIWEKRIACRGKGRTARTMNSKSKGPPVANPAGLWASAVRFWVFVFFLNFLL